MHCIVRINFTICTDLYQFVSMVIMYQSVNLTLGDLADLYYSYDYSDYYDDYPQFSLTTIDPNRVHIKPLDEEINCTLADFQKRRYVLEPPDLVW